MSLPYNTNSQLFGALAFFHMFNGNEDETHLILVETDVDNHPSHGTKRYGGQTYE